MLLIAYLLIAYCTTRLLLEGEPVDSSCDSPCDDPWFDQD